MKSVGKIWATFIKFLIIIRILTTCFITAITVGACNVTR
jgi:hypothetical protein